MLEGIGNFFGVMLSYFAEMAKPKTIIMIVALVAVALMLLAIRKKKGYNTRTLTYGAICIAIAFILSMIKIPWPQGGSITPASMLPIFIFAYVAGPRAGILAGLCYGLLQFIQAPYYYSPIQFILDYLLAFGLLGFAGIIRKNIFVVVVFGGILRFICHFLSGVFFFANFAPKGQSVYLYSLIYNGSFMAVEIVICVLILLVPSIRLAIDRLKINPV